MNRLVNIGFGNYTNPEKIVAVIRPDSAPAKRLVQTAKDNGTAIDATQGRKTKGVIIAENGSVILSALLPETIAGRCLGESGLKGDNGQKGDDGSKGDNKSRSDNGLKGDNGAKGKAESTL